jgi:PEGA domain
MQARVPSDRGPREIINLMSDKPSAGRPSSDMKAVLDELDKVFAEVPLPESANKAPAGPALAAPKLSIDTKPSRRWNVLGVAAAVLGIVAVVEFALLSREFGRPTTPTTGTVTVESTPAGAAITINGQKRGTAPATLTLAPGEYGMLIAGANATRNMPLVVRAGSSQHIYFEETAPPVAPPEADDSVKTSATLAGPARDAKPVNTAPPPIPAPAKPAGGWLSVAAPIDVQLSEGGTALGTNKSGRIALPIGNHVIDAANASLGFKASYAVQINTGAAAIWTLAVPPAAVNINAIPWAEVAVDGKGLGATPLGNVSLSLGPHEIVFTHPQFGERRQTVMVTANGPNRVSVDLNPR